MLDGQITYNLFALFQLDEHGADCMTVKDFMGQEQVESFKQRYCAVATLEEISAAGFDAQEISSEENFYRLIACPSQIFRIPGFGQFYRVKSQWQMDQIIHPWLL